MTVKYYVENNEDLKKRKNSSASTCYIQKKKKKCIFSIDKNEIIWYHIHTSVGEVFFSCLLGLTARLRH